jgi:hypothetical protein
MKQKSHSSIGVKIVNKGIDKVEENLIFNYRGIGISRFRLLSLFTRLIEFLRKQ